MNVSKQNSLTLIEIRIYNVKSLKKKKIDDVFDSVAFLFSL